MAAHKATAILGVVISSETTIVLDAECISTDKTKSEAGYQKERGVSMAEPKIQQFRVSFAWLRAFPDLLNGSAPDAPMALLGNKTDYAARFDAVQNELTARVKAWDEQHVDLIQSAKTDASVRNKLFVQRVAAYRAFGSNPLHITPLWDWMQPNYIHHFWDRYLNRKEESLAGVTGAQAWDAVVPLRLVPPFKVNAPWLNGGIVMDGLLYPHAVGLTFMVNVALKNGVGYGKLMELLFKIRENENFQVTMPDESVVELKLDRLANLVLKDLLGRVFGEDVPETFSLDGPLSVATFIHVQGVNAQEPVADASTTHRVLHGISTWDPAWENVAKEALLSIPILNLALPGKRNVPGNITYHGPRGRTVWFPNWFSKTPGRGNHRLSCYHRNLTLAVVQTEALALAAQLAYPDLALDQKPPAPIAAFALNAANRARALYLRDKKTYRSASPEAQLNENFLDEVKLMDVVMKVRQGLSAA